MGWLRRDSGLVELRGRVGTNLGKIGDVWADEDGEHISVVYEDEPVLALDLATSEFMRAAAAKVEAEPAPALFNRSRMCPVRRECELCSDRSRGDAVGAELTRSSCGWAGLARRLSKENTHGS